MSVEELRKEHNEVLAEITSVVSILESPSMASPERSKLRQKFKDQLTRAIALEEQLFDILSLNFRRK